MVTVSHILRSRACSPRYLYDELPFFQPRRDNRNALYLGEPMEQKGIHCRFGMKGVIAENHFDASRNAIVVLGGRRRYILSHPNQCENLALLPRDHESARHSEVDYSDPDLERFPEFANAKANEVVLTAGQVFATLAVVLRIIITSTSKIAGFKKVREEPGGRMKRNYESRRKATEDL
eukprot:scaffold1943_cov160-Amphora_coffeaeformis.AAC.4